MIEVMDDVGPNCVSLKCKFLSYQSGTHIVTRDNFGELDYYVYADDRYSVCKEIVRWLNNGVVPSWGKSLERISDVSCKGDDGISISTVGPMVLPPCDNGALAWRPDESGEARKKRFNLIGVLLGENYEGFEL